MRAGAFCFGHKSHIRREVAGACASAYRFGPFNYPDRAYTSKAVQVGRLGRGRSGKYKKPISLYPGTTLLIYPQEGEPLLLVLVDGTISVGLVSEHKRALTAKANTIYI